jgi:hypothetical protein
MPKEGELVEIPVEDLTLDDFPQEDVIIDINDGTGVIENPELDAANVQLELLKAEQLNMKSQIMQNELMANTLKNINDNLDGKNKTIEEDTQPQLDLKSIIDNVDKNLVLKPGETLMSALVPIVQQLEQGYELKLGKRDKELGKLQLYQNDDHKALYSKYTQEVDTLAASYSGTEAYTKAIKEVQLNHSDEIMSEKLASMKESLLEELKKEMGSGSGNSSSSQSSTFTNASANLNPGKRHISITPGDLKIVKDWAFQTAGLFEIDKDPVRLANAIELAKEQGIIK